MAAALRRRELAKRPRRQAVGVGCDVADPAVRRGDGATGGGRSSGSVHVLHNNAASKSDDLAAFFAPFEEYSLDEWRKIMAVNIDGMFLVAQAVGGRMVEQGTGGSIIQTASIYGILASDKRIYEGSFYLGRQISNPAVYSDVEGGRGRSDQVPGRLLGRPGHPRQHAGARRRRERPERYVQSSATRRGCRWAGWRTATRWSAP